MLSENENDLLTRVGPGSPTGKLMRRYWLPALLTEEIPVPDCALVRVPLLGSYRGNSLYFGRNEECGLTCICHGWKYDVDGHVLETPAEPASSDFFGR